MIREDEVSSTKKEQFDLYKTRIKTYFTTGFVKDIIEYNKIFGQEIWITEWNLQMTKTTGNTMLQSFFVSHYLLEILSNPFIRVSLFGRVDNSKLFINNL